MMTKLRPQDCCPVPAIAEPALREGGDWFVSGLRALGDPTRLEILRLVAGQQDPICVCDIVARFDVSQPTISHHLRVLRDAGLVTVSRRGIWAYYAADPSSIVRLREAFDTLLPRSAAARH